LRVVIAGADVVKEILKGRDVVAIVAGVVDVPFCFKVL